MECEKLKCTSPEQRELLARAGFINLYGLPIPQYEISRYGGTINPTFYPIVSDLGRYDVLGKDLPEYCIIVPDVVYKNEIWVAYTNGDSPSQMALFTELIRQLCPNGQGVSFKIAQNWPADSLAKKILARVANPDAILP